MESARESQRKAVIGITDAQGRNAQLPTPWVVTFERWVESCMPPGPPHDVEGCLMRKLILQMQMSVDGFVGSDGADGDLTP